MVSLAVRGTILVAMLAWAAAEWLRLSRPLHWREARALWTAGALLAVSHMAAALHLVYHWDHEAALAATAEQTAAVTGLAWSVGLYVNYLFIALWVWDACVWWMSPDAYRARSRRHANVLRAVFLFMFANGGIIFARGLGRSLGIVAVAAVLWAWLAHASAGREAGAARPQPPGART
jgi:hypothetical protein